MTRPGNSGDEPIAGFVTIAAFISGCASRLRIARSVKVRAIHSDIEATLCGFSSMAMSRAMRSTADLHKPKTTPYV